MKIGIVDLDTSHPQNWIPIERELGHETVGVWDGGSVHPREYVAEFAKTHYLGPVFDSLEDLAAAADCAIIHGCDWDTHVDKARPFVEAGKSVLIDKPMAGTLGDLNQFVAWVKDGARISGGSSLRFCEETREWLAQPVEERGTPHTILCGCGVDDFNYGIHAYSMLSGIMGPGIKSVRHLGGGVQHRIQVTWDDGALGLLVVGEAGTWLPFYATITTEKTITQFQADSGNLYRGLLEAVCPYLAGETDDAPIPIEALIEPELCAMAARQSWLHGDCDVALSDLSVDDEGYDGALFAKGYREAKYGA
jgi:Oxidoreductase family, NAD-binding Rossmann fold